MLLVSVIMPAYNSGKYIVDSVETVIKQSFTNWELIIIDDCSTDNTFELLQPYIEKWQNIRYYRLAKHSGVAAARTAGSSKVKGEYIAFLDSDDLWHPDKLKVQLNCLIKKHADLIYTGARCINDKGELLDRYFKVPPSVDYSSLLLGNAIICSSVLVKTELIRRFPMQRSDLHEDYICWLSILREGHKAVGINQPFVFYRLAENSKARNKFKSARMTYEVYKFMGIPLLRRVLCFAAYAVHGVNRYLK